MKAKLVSSLKVITSFAYIFGVAFLIAGMILGTLAKPAQADPGPIDCNHIEGGIKVENPPYTLDASGGQIITSVWVKSGSKMDFCRQLTMEKPSDGCYTASGLGSSHVEVTGGGTSSECQAISHVIFILGEKEQPTSTPTPTCTKTEKPTHTPETPEDTVTPKPSHTPKPSNTPHNPPEVTPTEEEGSTATPTPGGEKKTQTPTPTETEPSFQVETPTHTPVPTDTSEPTATSTKPGNRPTSTNTPVLPPGVTPTPTDTSTPRVPPGQATRTNTAVPQAATATNRPANPPAQLATLPPPTANATPILVPITGVDFATSLGFRTFLMNLGFAMLGAALVCHGIYLKLRG